MSGLLVKKIPIQFHQVCYFIAICLTSGIPTKECYHHLNEYFEYTNDLFDKLNQTNYLEFKDESRNLSDLLIYNHVNDQESILLSILHSGSIIGNSISRQLIFLANSLNDQTQKESNKALSEQIQFSENENIKNFFKQISLDRLDEWNKFLGLS